MEDISAGKLEVAEEPINISSWSRLHSLNTVNEDHLPSVDISKTVLQAEIRAGAYNIIDGNHRIEKARREGVKLINSYKMKGEQLLLCLASRNYIDRQLKNTEAGRFS